MLNVAIIGSGRMGQIYANHISRNPDCQLSYVVSRTQASAERLAQQYEGVQATTDVDVMLSDASVGAVIIVSSTPTHVDYIIAAAKAGKAIFCEKPIDLDIERVQACLAVLEQHPVPFMLGFNRRFDPEIDLLQQRIQNGEIGQPSLLLLTSRDPAPPPIDYVKSSGGYFLDSTIHDIDLACWLMGEAPEEVVAFGSNLVDPAIGAVGDVDTTMTMLKFPSGAICHVNNSRQCSYGFDQRIEAFGEKGMLQTQNQHESTIVAYTGTHTRQQAKLKHFFLERYEASFTRIMAQFVDAVIHQQPITCNQYDGRRALIIALALTQSLQDKTVIKPDYGTV